MLIGKWTPVPLSTWEQRWQKLRNATHAKANCRAGGPGYAFAFDAMLGTVVSLKWDGPPLPHLTVEYWLNILDPHFMQQAGFAYSAYSVGGRYGVGPAYENANEFEILHSPTYTRLFHSTTSVDLSSTKEYDLAESWVHVAVVWTADPALSPHGQVAYYLNGELFRNATACAASECDMGMPIQPNGVVSVGQEPDKPWGDFDELQGLAGVLDEFRVWESIRTDAEIRSSFENGILTSSDSGGLRDGVGGEGLSFYWRFDEPGLERDSLALDSSGRGRHGLVGGMTTTENQIQWVSGKPSQVPVAPTQLPSTALFVGNGPIVVPIVEGLNRVTLLGSDPVTPPH